MGTLHLNSILCCGGTGFEMGVKCKNELHAFPYMMYDVTLLTDAYVLVSNV